MVLKTTTTMRLTTTATRQTYIQCTIHMVYVYIETCENNNNIGNNSNNKRKKNNNNNNGYNNSNYNKLMCVKTHESNNKL